MKTLFCTVLAAVTVALGGCETESSDRIAVSISPSNVTIRKGESREFTASGWRDYTWSLSDKSIGTLSTTQGDSTIYTAVADAPTNSSPQVLTVTVDVASSTTDSSTNAIPGTGGSLVSAEALIYLDTEVIVDGAIAISPSVVTIKTGQSVELKAVGPDGVTDYTWKLKGPVNGVLSALAGASTIFTATNGPSTTIEAPFTQIVGLSSNRGKNTTTAAITISSFP